LAQLASGNANKDSQINALTDRSTAITAQSHSIRSTALP